VLETLGPTERAVLVLHAVVAVSYDEIAEAVGKTTATVRQIAHRHASTWPRGARGWR
jgi:DNA-directed RNA polymerase specialized sigma24 family protein